MKTKKTIFIGSLAILTSAATIPTAILLNKLHKNEIPTQLINFEKDGVARYSHEGSAGSFDLKAIGLPNELHITGVNGHGHVTDTIPSGYKLTVQTKDGANRNVNEIQNGDTVLIQTSTDVLSGTPISLRFAVSGLTEAIEKLIVIPKINKDGNLATSDQYIFTTENFSSLAGTLKIFHITPKNANIVIPDYYKTMFSFVLNRKLIKFSGHASINEYEEDIESAFSKYYYGTLSNSFSYWYKADTDQKLIDFALVTDANGNAGDNPMSHLKVGAKDVRYTITSQNGQTTSGTIENWDETLFHQDADFWSILSSVLSPITGTIGAALEAIGGGITGLATWIVDEAGNGHGDVSFGEHMRYFTGISDKYGTQDPGMLGTIFRFATGSMATLGAFEAVSFIKSASTFLSAMSAIKESSQEFLDMAHHLTEASGLLRDITDQSSNEEKRKAFEKIVEAFDVDAEAFRDINDFKEILDKLSSMSKQQVDEILAMSKTDRTKVLISFANPIYTQSFVNQIKNLIQGFKSLDSVEHLPNHVLSNPISLKAGDTINIFGLAEVEFGANHSGWSLFHPSGYESKGTLSKIDAVGEIQNTPAIKGDGGIKQN